MEMRKLWQIIRDSLFSNTNKEFLIFLFFLALSGFFWLFLALSESYEKEFAIPVTITDVPKNIMLTSDETDTVRITIRDISADPARLLFLLLAGSEGRRDSDYREGMWALRVEATRLS